MGRQVPLEGMQPANGHTDKSNILQKNIRPTGKRLDFQAQDNVPPISGSRRSVTPPAPRSIRKTTRSTRRSQSCHAHNSIPIPGQHVRARTSQLEPLEPSSVKSETQVTPPPETMNSSQGWSGVLLEV